MKKKHQHDQGNVSECCKNKKRHKMTMISRNCPCGDNKMPGLPGAEKTEILPYRFKEGIVALAEDTLFSSHKKRLTDHHKFRCKADLVPGIPVAWGNPLSGRIRGVCLPDVLDAEGKLYEVFVPVSCRVELSSRQLLK
jgi:hypothetical protein